MDIISAYREAGTFRGAAVISGTTHKTVRRVIARHEAGGGGPARLARAGYLSPESGHPSAQVSRAVVLTWSAVVVLRDDCREVSARGPRGL
jgi:hypothetical protein